MSPWSDNHSRGKTLWFYNSFADIFVLVVDHMECTQLAFHNHYCLKQVIERGLVLLALFFTLCSQLSWFSLLKDYTTYIKCSLATTTIWSPMAMRVIVVTINGLLFNKAMRKPMMNKNHSSRHAHFSIFNLFYDEYFIHYLLQTNMQSLPILGWSILPKTSLHVTCHVMKKIRFSVLVWPRYK
jgi:hypothetical protein